MRARALGAVAVCLAALSILAIEAASWRSSARFGPLGATTFQCAVRLDGLSSADRAAGLHDGDVLDLRAMDVRARVAEVFHYTPTQAGHAGDNIALIVSRAGSTSVIPYTLAHTDPWTTFAAQLAFKAILLSLALLLLYRGSDSASLLLGIWCTSVGLGLPDAWWGILPVNGRIAGGALTALLWTCSPFVLYLVVEATAKGVSQRVRIITRCIMAILILPDLFVNVVDATAQAAGGCAIVPVSTWMSGAAFAASQLVIIAFFALSYVRTTGLAKQRLRWVFWAFVFSRAGVLLNLLNRLLVHPLHLSGFEWVTVLIFPVGCAYAILRHRIFDVNFVLNRTLVFTILTSFVIGIFILLEKVLEGAAAGRGVGLAVETVVALVIGFSFNAMHKRLEEWIARALFRAKFEAANALRRLAEEAPYMEREDALLMRTVGEVQKSSGASAVAIYERADDAYRLSASDGMLHAPEELEIDDLAFVRMRKTRGPVDLGDVESALGTDGIVFPFSTRGTLTGAMVCRRRPNGEAYAPDEIALLAGVAHEVGSEIGAIRARRQAEMLDAILSGNLEVRDVRAQFEAT
jgi:hypothetical protein